YSLAGASDPSTVDAASLHYSFALTTAGLAANYAAAGAANGFAPTFADNGTYTVYAQVYDKDGAVGGPYSFTETVNNSPPTITLGTQPTGTFTEGTAVGGFSATVTDPANVGSVMNDPITYTWS